MDKIKNLLDEVKVYRLCGFCDDHGAGECLNTEGCNCKEEITRQIVQEIRESAIDDLSDWICCSPGFTNQQKDFVKKAAEKVKKEYV